MSNIRRCVVWPDPRSRRYESWFQSISSANMHVIKRLMVNYGTPRQIQYLNFNRICFYVFDNIHPRSASHDLQTKQILPLTRSRPAVFRVHRVLEKSLKVLEFRQKIPGPWKSFENRVGPWKSLNLNVPYFEIFAY